MGDDIARATTAGMASSHASMRLSDWRGRVERKYATAASRTLADEGEPSDAELTNLRNRYIEFRALDDNSKALLALARADHWITGVTASICSGVYRLTLFVAALIVIYRWHYGV